MDRRTFLMSGTAAMAAPVAPSERVTMGLIGAGNQGLNDLKGFLRDERVQVVAVCDVNKESPGYWDGGVAGREPARQFIEWNYAREKKDRKSVV